MRLRKLIFILLDSLVAADMVVRHIERCKELPFLQYALPIIIPESNLPLIAMQLQRDLKRDYKVRWQFMTEDKNKNDLGHTLPGSVTTHTNKLESVNILTQNYLKKNKIVFYQDFVVAASEGAETTSGINVKKEFERQLRDFARIKKYKDARDGSKYVEFSYHGKSSGCNDDFVMTLLIAVRMHKIFWEKEKYANLRAL